MGIKKSPVRVIDEGHLLETLLCPDALRRLERSGFKVTLKLEGRDDAGDIDAALEAVVAELGELQARLERQQRMSALGELGAGVTHQTRNIMTGILSFAQVALRKLDQPERIEYLLSSIEKESLRCIDLVTGYLDVARHHDRSSQPAQPLVATDLNRVVATTTAVVKEQLVLRRIRLEVELGADLPWVDGNANDLRLAILNLLINAMQATPENGLIRVASSSEADQVVVTIADTGPGVPLELKERIFEPFFTTKPAGEGTGLGLAATARVIANHRGTITVTNRDEGGADFTIRLPARVEDQG